MRKRLLLALMTVVVAATPAAAAAPEGLKGKSVVIRWTENRTQRRSDETEMRQVRVGVVLSVYVSTAGRAFGKMARSLGGRAASRERGPDESLTGGAGRTSFSGNQMIIDNQYRSGARRVVVDFDAGFAGCRAQVIQGKEAGSSQMRMKSMVTGASLIVQSIQIDAPSCEVRAGNIVAQ